ncbi:MAG: hypothetical protein ABI304_05490 [Rudaea sp.]
MGTDIAFQWIRIDYPGVIIGKPIASFVRFVLRDIRQEQLAGYPKLRTCHLRIEINTPVHFGLV